MADKTTPEIQPEAPVKTPYRTLSRINHDLEEYEPNELILLPDVAAEPLLALGAVTVIEK